MIQFMDLSHHDNDRGPINWTQLAKEMEGFIIKFTEGTTFLDPKACENFNNAKKTGKPVGAYHFFHGKGKEEASYFKCKLPPNVDFVAIDCEDATLQGDITDEVLAFADEMDKPVLLYTSPDYLKNHFNKKVTKLPLWIAHYNVDKPDIGFYKDYDMWQYSSNAVVKGKTGMSDVDYVQQSFYDVLRPKKKVTLTKAQYVVVKSKDTAWDIAKKYKVTLSKLKKLNPSIKDLSRIYPGQKMRVK